MGDLNENILYNNLIDDMRDGRSFLHKLCLVLCLIILILSFGLIGTALYCQKKTFDFVNDFDIESTIEMENNDSTNYGSISSY